MPCAFHYDRPEPFDHLDSGCQFATEAGRLIADEAGNQYCQFHLPLDSQIRSLKDLKRTWDATRVSEFSTALIEFMDKAADKDEAFDFSGVEFPGEFDFRRYIDLKNPRVFLLGETRFAEKPNFSGVRVGDHSNLEHAIFSSGANFRESIFGEECHFDRMEIHHEADFYDSRFGVGSSFKDQDSKFPGIEAFLDTNPDAAPAYRS